MSLAALGAVARPGPPPRSGPGKKSSHHRISVASMSKISAPTHRTSVVADIEMTEVVFG